VETGDIDRVAKLSLNTELSLSKSVEDSEETGKIDLNAVILPSTSKGNKRGFDQADKEPPRKRLNFRQEKEKVGYPPHEEARKAVLAAGNDLDAEIKHQQRKFTLRLPSAQEEEQAIKVIELKLDAAAQAYINFEKSQDHLTAKLKLFLTNIRNRLVKIGYITEENPNLKF
jgi:hypothetical protein